MTSASSFRMSPTDAVAWRHKMSLILGATEREVLRSSTAGDVEPSTVPDKILFRSIIRDMEKLDIVLWEHNLWRASHHGHESLAGAHPDTGEILGAHPQLWIFEDFEVVLEKRSGGPLSDKVMVALALYPIGIAEDEDIKKAGVSVGAGYVDRDRYPGLRVKGRALAVVGILLKVGAQTAEEATPQFHHFGFVSDLTDLAPGVTLPWASYLFTQQPFATAEREPVPRPLRRREEARIGKAPEVYRIALRRPKHEAAVAGSESASREWSCSWMVAGHWRKQWFSSLKAHRPIYIHSYVKGDTDKPLKAPRQRVYEVVR